MSKKAISGGFLTSALIAVVVVIALFIIASKIVPLLFLGTDVETCRASVALKLQTTSIAPDSLILDNIACYTRYVEFRKDGIYKKNTVDSKYRKVASYGENKEEKTKEWFARELADCWYQFDEGKALPFGQDIATSSSHCVQCSELTFGNDIINELPKSITGFNAWMAENEISGYQSKIASEQGVSYKDYLDRNQEILSYQANVGRVHVPFTARKINIKTLKANDQINPAEKYYVLIVTNIPAYIASLGVGEPTFLSKIERAATVVLISESELAQGSVDCQRMY